MQEQQDAALESPQDEVSSPQRGLARDVALYTVARFGLLAALAAVLTVFGVPLLVALVVAVVLAMPLSLVLFGRLRRRVASGMAERSERRRLRKEELRAELRGERDAESTDGNSE